MHPLAMIAAIMSILGSGVDIFKTMSTKLPEQSPGVSDPSQDRARKMAMLQAMMGQNQPFAQPQLDPLAQIMAMFQQQQPPGGMGGMFGGGGFRG